MPRYLIPIDIPIPIPMAADKIPILVSILDRESYISIFEQSNV